MKFDEGFQVQPWREAMSKKESATWSMWQGKATSLPMESAGVSKGEGS